MSNDLETRLEEAFAARAATTTTSDDAWARVSLRGARHDHRRSVVLRSVAAAVVVVLAVGGGVALFRDRGGSGTVATGGADASKSMAEDSAASGAVVPPAPFVPAGNGLEVQQNPDGTIVVRLGSTTTEPVQPGGISAAIDGDTVFGVVPESGLEVVFGVVPDQQGAVRAIGLGGGATLDVEGLVGARLFAAQRSTVAWAPTTEDAVSVSALGNEGDVAQTIARRNG
ncbi:MAG: hypothetical protein ACXW2C_08165 [Acidimicrobiia bacterium]